MADHPVERLGGQTPLQYTDTPYMDMLARKGRTGRLMTIPTGFAPGSEVANSAILGYDLNKVYEGRGPLEAASIGYEMQPGDMAAPNKPVYLLSLDTTKWVRAYVNEKDLGRIYEGMPATVTIDSLPGQTLSGTVGFISGTAEFTPKQVQTTELRTDLVYEVRINVEDPNNVLRLGMPATVTFDNK